MNIHFDDRLSQIAWCYLASLPQHQEQFDQFLLRHFRGGWHTVRPDIKSDPENPERPDWAHQTGAIVQLHIAADTYWRNFYWVENDGFFDDPEARIPATREFNWAICSYPVSPYGQIESPSNFTHIINGGWVNHGTHEEPSWSSHT